MVRVCFSNQSTQAKFIKEYFWGIEIITGAWDI